MTPARKVLCKSCGTGHMQPIQQEKTFSPPEATVTVITLAAKCDHCGSTRVLASQMDENLARLSARKKAYGPHFMGEEIYAFRRKHGLSQNMAAKMFGTGAKAFYRFERETAFPSQATRMLLSLAMNRPEILRELADMEGLVLPLPVSIETTHSPG